MFSVQILNPQCSNRSENSLQGAPHKAAQRGRGILLAKKKQNLKSVSQAKIFEFLVKKKKKNPTKLKT